MKSQVSNTKYSIKLLVTTFLCFIFVNQIKAATIYVYNTDKIGDAINIANNGDLILVYPGTYKGEGNVNLDFMGKAIEVKSINGPDVTIIDCELAGQTRAFKFNNSETSSSILSGFTIRNGNAGYVPIGSGGAIFISSSPTIENCIFENNTALIGGAIQVFSSSSVATPIIKNCTFKNNSTTDNGSGGAINLATNAGATIENCIFDSNFSDFHGGTISIYYDSPSEVQILNCLFQSNYTDGWGTIYVDRTSYVSISRSTFVNNDALLGGAALAIFNQNSNLEFKRNIVAFNGTTGLVSGNNALPTFSCNDFYQNNGGSIVGSYDSTIVDVNTIFEDPLFCDIENNNFFISSYSPCDEDSSKCGLLIGKYQDNCNYCCNFAGDVNNSNSIDISDLVYLVAFMFQEGSPPPCPDEGDTNGSGQIDISDLVHLVNYMFGSPPGSAPVCS